MESNILLMKPDASNIGVANPYRWIHYDKDGLHYYEKEFTQMVHILNDVKIHLVIQKRLLLLLIF